MKEFFCINRIDIIQKTIVFFIFIHSFFQLNAQTNISKAYTMLGTFDEKIELNLNIDKNLSLQPFSEFKNFNISGLSITGELKLNSDTSLVRIILVDENSSEYLIYEAYSLLVEDLSSVFNQIGEETVLLNNVKPKAIKIKIVDASVQIKEIDVSLSDGLMTRSMNDILKQQQQDKIERINQNIQKRGQKWVAGETSVSRMTYEEKKNLFGGEVPNLNGFEYYSGGIFVMSESDIEQSSPSVTLQATEEESPYVDEFSWTDRHGEDWTSPVKNQEACGSCWAFSAVAATEQLANLYYNQHLDLDLSEQDVVSCSGAGSCDGGYADLAIDYIASIGVVDEACFAYNASDLPCSSKCSSPNELIKIEGYSSIYKYTSVDELKKMVIKGPVSASITPWAHALNLVGYKTIKAGDRIYIKNYEEDRWVTIAEGDPLIGQTAWLFKNSWGTYWGNSGFVYIVTNTSNIGWKSSVSGAITSMNYTDSDIKCIDNDGDGFYNWGIGPKPAHCSDCPDEPDGDDSDPCLGPMNEYGVITSMTTTPKTSDVSIVYGELVPDLYAEGQNIKWYSDAELSNLVHEGENFSTGHTEIGIYTYYVTQTIDCKSLASMTTLTIQPTPPNVENVTAYENQGVISLSAEGENIKWYSNSDELFCDPRDGQYYNLTNINNQVWMAENLNYYTESGSAYYNNDSSTYANEYGRLYNQETSQNVCPNGFQLPTDKDWNELELFLGITNSELYNVGSYRGEDAGGKLKESGYINWESPNSYANNQYGFSALPGGYFRSTDRKFIASGWCAYFRYKEGYRVLTYNSGGIIRINSNSSNELISIRCIKDFNAIAEGNTFFPNLSISGTSSFNVTQTVNGVESNPATLTLTIYSNSPKPGTENISATVRETIPNLTATGQNIKWYTDAELTNLVHEGESFATGHTSVGIYTYYVTQTIGIESEPVQVTLTILPSPPMAEDVTVCEGQDNAILYADGQNIKWYNSEVQPLYDERDGQTYKTKVIGEQQWMAENLDYNIENASWYYNNDSLSFSKDYGRLYKWETALNVCPTGWQLPTDADWKQLEMYLGMSESEADKIGFINRGIDEGGKMKEIGTFHWDYPNQGANNQSGFNGLPGGHRYYTDGKYEVMGSYGNWWTSTGYDSNNAIRRALAYNTPYINRMYMDKSYGFSVRCVKDNNTTFIIAEGNTYLFPVTSQESQIFYVTQTVNGIESKATEVKLFIEYSPIVNLGGNYTICQGETQVLDAGSGFDSYSWSNGETSQTTEVNETGTYSVTVTIGNCSNSDGASVTVNPIPEVNLGGDYTICQGETQVLDAGSGFDSYLWSNGETSQTIEVSETETYSVSVTQENCSNSDETIVTVNPLPNVNLGGDFSICQGEIQVLDAGSGFDSYSWSNGESTQTIEVNETGTYSVTVTQGNCSNSDEATATVNPLPEIDLGENYTISENETQVLDAGSGFDTYSWNNGESSQTIEVNETGIYSVTVTQGDCSNNDEATVTVNPLSGVDLGDDYTISQGETQVLDAGPGFDTYSWNNGETSQTIEVSVTGTYSVIVTLGNNSYSDEVIVTVSPFQELELGGDFSICQGKTQVLDAGLGFDTYSWSNGETSQSIEVSATGTYSVTVTQGNNSYSDESIVTVIPMPETPIAEDVTLCQGEPVPDLTAAGESIKWYSDAGLTDLVHTGSNYPTSQTTVVTFTYYATQTVSGCESLAKTITLEILDLPVFDLGNDTTINTEQTISLSLDNPNYSFNWSNGSNLSSIDIIGSEIGVGIHEYWIDITDLNNCTNSDTIFVTVKTSTNIGINKIADQIQIYPNPANDLIYVNFKNEEITEFIIEITDLVGNKILSESMFVTSTYSSSEIDISNLPSGLYVIEVKWLNYLISKKLIVE